METDKHPLIVQLSDLHIGADWVAFDPLERFRACVAAVRCNTIAPDAVIVSGDLAEHGSADEYAPVQAELARLNVPVYVVPGNHDDRSTLRRCFDLPGADAGPIHYAADVDQLRLIMLDSTLPNEARGDLDRARLDWLEAALQETPARPTIIVMHHPPVRTGVPVFDAIGLAENAQRELAAILGQHRQVLAVVAGHLHRPITGFLADTAALTAPSAYAQIRLDFAATELAVADEEPPAFAVHTLVDDRLVSHVQLVPWP